jgi:hypothetical protein
VPSRIARSARLAAVAAIASLAVAAPASADPSACSAPPATSPFLPWGDPNDYFLAPGGDFESKAGWTFTGGAQLVAGSEPFAASGRLGKRSLSLPPGSTALSPVLCLTPENASIRFFAKAVGGDDASLRGAAIISRSGRQVVALGAVGGTDDWAPAEPMASGVAEAAWTHGRTAVQLRFTADSGAWQIDDLFVDPQKRG